LSGLSQAISAQFTLEMCAAAQNRKKSVKSLLRVQSHWPWCQSKGRMWLPISDYQ